MNKDDAGFSRRPVEQHLIGVQFERDLLTAGLIDVRGRLLDKQQIETPRRTTTSVAEAISGMILSLAAGESRGQADIGGIGISAPGLVDPPTGRVSVEGMRSWNRVNLPGLIEEFLSDSGRDIRRAAGRKSARAQVNRSAHPPIVIDSRANCMAAAESWIGVARGRSNVVCLSIGEDIEAGMLADGRPLRGASGYAGAVAWLALTGTWKGDYRDHGALGAEATGPALIRKAIEQWGSNPDSLLGKLIKADASRLDIETIIRSAKADDALAQSLIDDLTGWLGRCLASLIAVLNPDSIVLNGPLGLALKPWLDEIREETARWAHPESGDDCRISVSTLGERAILIGAARLARPAQ